MLQSETTTCVNCRAEKVPGPILCDYCRRKDTRERFVAAYADRDEEREPLDFERQAALQELCARAAALEEVADFFWLPLDTAGDVRTLAWELAQAVGDMGREVLASVAEPNDGPPPPPHGGFQIRFDGPPSAVTGRFVETEDLSGRGIRLGRWKQDGDDWLLVVEPYFPQPLAESPGGCLRDVDPAEYGRRGEVVAESEDGETVAKVGYRDADGWHLGGAQISAEALAAAVERDPRLSIQGDGVFYTGRAS